MLAHQLCPGVTQPLLQASPVLQVVPDQTVAPSRKCNHTLSKKGMWKLALVWKGECQNMQNMYFEFFSPLAPIYFSPAFSCSARSEVTCLMTP